MRVPDLLYGTAWKEAATADCVRAALAAGFRGIDTANQRKHYHEAGVGEALRDAGIPRDELFLQTKFTFRAGQDERLPYDDGASIADQVAQSFASSLEHLGTDRIDSFVLHGPSQAGSLGPDDTTAWRAMERIADDGRTALLGVSNVSSRQLEELLALGRIAPAFVQNRCYADRGWDTDVRGICQRRGITYQGFSLLTANRHVLARASTLEIAKHHGATPAQVVFAFARRIGILPLTGTRDPVHMAQDLAAIALPLSADDVARIERAE